MAEFCLGCGGELTLVLRDVFDTRFGVPGFYDIARCGNCGLEMTLPRPSSEELNALYTRYYNFGGESGTAYTGRRERFLRSRFYRWWLKLDGDISFHNRHAPLQKFLPGASAEKRLIDIGCNEGRSLSLYHRNGFSAVEGLETNPVAAAAARGRGFTIHEQELAAFRPARKYDVAVLSNVLEHATDPAEMLRDVARILNPMGEVWVSCPNARSWARRIWGRYWINWHVPFHIVHFSRQTLEQTLRRGGFVPITTEDATPALWIAQSLIARLFAKPGAPTRELRHAPLVVGLILLFRGVLFPILWFGNRLGRGDCLTIVARRRPDHVQSL